MSTVQTNGDRRKGQAGGAQIGEADAQRVLTFLKRRLAPRRGDPRFAEFLEGIEECRDSAAIQSNLRDLVSDQRELIVAATGLELSGRWKLDFDALLAVAVADAERAAVVSELEDEGEVAEQLADDIEVGPASATAMVEQSEGGAQGTEQHTAARPPACFTALRTKLMGSTAIFIPPARTLPAERATANGASEPKANVAPRMASTDRPEQIAGDEPEVDVSRSEIEAGDNTPAQIEQTPRLAPADENEPEEIAEQPDGPPMRWEVVEAWRAVARAAGKPIKQRNVFMDEAKRLGRLVREEWLDHQQTVDNLQDIANTYERFGWNADVLQAVLAVAMAKVNGDGNSYAEETDGSGRDEQQTKHVGRDDHRAAIIPSPYAAPDPSTIPRRDWLLGNHYIRGFVTATVAPGGLGKTTLSLSDAVAMARSGLRVWYWNGEDPKEEIERRLAALCQHLQIDAKSLKGCLFIDSCHEMPLKLAVSAGGSKITFADDVIAGFAEAITSSRIDVVILDPFVACHCVSENDNVAIDQVVKQLAHIAKEASCSIELVHHVRKPSRDQSELTADDARGGGAIVNAVRSCRVLNRMIANEASKAGVNNRDRRAYIRVDKGKANMAPPEGATWMRLVSVTIANGDNVQAVEPWQFPWAFDGVTVEDVEFIRQAARTKAYRADPRAKEWIGHAVADRLALNIEESGVRAKIRAIIETWIENGVLAIEQREDDHRKKREFVVPGPRSGTPSEEETDDAPVE